MSRRKIPYLISTLLLALGGVFVVVDQAQAGPIHNPGGTPFVKVGVYQGLLSIVPGQPGDSVMEIGYQGRYMASTGEIFLRPVSGSIPDGSGSSIRIYHDAVDPGQASLSVPGRLCLEGSCIHLWSDLTGTTPPLDTVLGAGNASNRSIVLGQGTTTLPGVGLIDAANTASIDKDALSGKSVRANRSGIYAENTGGGYAGYFSGRVRVELNGAGDALAGVATNANAAILGQQNQFNGWAGYFTGGNGLFATKFRVDFAPGTGAGPHLGIDGGIAAGAGCNTGPCTAIYGEDNSNSVFSNLTLLGGYFWAGFFNGPVGIRNNNRPSPSLFTESNQSGISALRVKSFNDTDIAANFIGDISVTQQVTTDEIKSGCYTNWVSTTTSAITNTITSADVNARCDGNNCTIDLSVPQAGGAATTGISSGRFRVDTGGVRQVFVGLESLGGGDGAANPVRRYIATAGETILQVSTSAAGQTCTFRWNGTNYELFHPAHAEAYWCDLRICD